MRMLLASTIVAAVFGCGGNGPTSSSSDNGIAGKYALVGPGVSSGVDVGIPFSVYQQPGYSLSVTGGSFTIASDFTYSLHVGLLLVTNGKSTNITWDAKGTYVLSNGDASFSRPSVAGTDEQFITWVQITRQVIAYLSPPTSLVALPNGLEADMTFGFNKQ